MPMSIKVLRPSIYLPRQCSRPLTPILPNTSPHSDVSTTFANLHLHRLLENVLTTQPSAAPMVEQLLTTLLGTAGKNLGSAARLFFTTAVLFL